MDISSVLSRAWQIIRRHKVLWIFGILAGCTGANTGASNFRYSASRGDLPPEAQRFFDQFGQQFGQMDDAQLALLIGGVILAVLLLVVLAVFLGTIGRIGLVRGTLQAEQGASNLSFGELFRGSLPYFWRVFGLNILVGLAAAAFVVIVSVPLAISVIGLACLFPLFCLLVPLSWLLTLILEQANAAIVVDDLGILAGLQRGWELFKSNLGTFILLGLILMLGIGLIGGFIIALPLFVVAVPAIIGVMSESNSGLSGGLLISGLCFVAYLPVLILLGGILQGYIQSAWALTYLRLTGRSAAAERAPVQPA
jgi:hypothetical protein